MLILIKFEKFAIYLFTDKINGKEELIEGKPGINSKIFILVRYLQDINRSVNPVRFQFVY